MSDNGTELTSTALLRWSQERGVAWHYIAPGKPTQAARGCVVDVGRDGQTALD